MTPPHDPSSHSSDGVPAQDIPTQGAASSSDKGRAFLRLFLGSERRVHAYVFTLVGNRTDADDVLQEASAVMWDKFDVTAPPHDFTAWACRIAYFKVCDFRKKHARSRIMFSQTMLDQVAETAFEQAATLELDRRRDALAGCLDKLPKRDSELVARRYECGATTASAAAAANRSIDAVYKALARIRRTLFDCVTRSLALQDR